MTKALCLMAIIPMEPEFWEVNRMNRKVIT